MTDRHGSTPEDQMDESFYLGIIEITTERITFDPWPADPEDCPFILMDFLSEADHQAPWDDPEIDQKLQPHALLRAVAECHFEVLLDHDNQETRRMAQLALDQGPYTGAIYAITTKWESNIALRSCEVEALAFRNGPVWHDPAGNPLSEAGRFAAAATVLAEIDLRTRWKR